MRSPSKPWLSIGLCSDARRGDDLAQSALAYIGFGTLSDRIGRDRAFTVAPRRRSSPWRCCWACRTRRRSATSMGMRCSGASARGAGADCSRQSPATISAAATWGALWARWGLLRAWGSRRKLGRRLDLRCTGQLHAGADQRPRRNGARVHLRGTGPKASPTPRRLTFFIFFHWVARIIAQPG
jgi:hypothetical protein